MAEEQAHKKFACPKCAGDMQFNPQKQRLVCPYCGAEAEAPKSAETASVEEHDLLSALQTTPKGTGYGTQTISMACDACGATSTYSDKVQATRCPFCDSARVRSLEGGEAVIQPESVLPFVVAKKDAGEKVVAWLGTGWFRPSDLKRLTDKLKFEGAYLPFWTFDAQTESQWRAEAGYYYYETEYYTETENGESVERSREVQRTRWENAYGNKSLWFDDVLVLASKGVPHATIEAVLPFDTKALKPYDADYLAGYLAERYAIDLREGWGVGKGKIDKAISSECTRDIPGDTHRGLSVTTEYSDLTYKHTLLPMWLGAYRYRDKVYQCVVNGQTGKVSGKAPLSPYKIASAVIFLLLLILIAIFFANSHHH